MSPGIVPPHVRRNAAIAFLAVVFGSTLWLLSPFFAALAWASILAYVTWPLYLRLERI